MCTPYIPPEVFISADTIAAKVKELGRQITLDYAGKPLTVISISNGAIIFVADLVRVIDLPLQLDSIMLASYNNSTSSSGNVVLRSQLKLDLVGRHLLVIDEILDTGHTLVKINEILSAKNPLSIRYCVLLNKQARRQADIRADYVGFEIPDKFVIGYGLDFNEYYRNLPYIGVMAEDRC